MLIFPEPFPMPITYDDSLDNADARCTCGRDLVRCADIPGLLEENGDALICGACDLTPDEWPVVECAGFDHERTDVYRNGLRICLWCGERCRDCDAPCSLTFPTCTACSLDDAVDADICF